MTKLYLPSQAVDYSLPISHGPRTGGVSGGERWTLGSSRENERPWEGSQTGDKKVIVPDGLWPEPSERDDDVERLMLTLSLIAFWQVS